MSSNLLDGQIEERDGTAETSSVIEPVNPSLEIKKDVKRRQKAGKSAILSPFRLALLCSFHSFQLLSRIFCISVYPSLEEIRRPVSRTLLIRKSSRSSVRL